MADVFKRALIASDHGGFMLKGGIKRQLEGKGFEYEDLGTDSEEACDYPDYALKVAKRVAIENGSAGILICGTGIGMCITANKVKGIRAALCWSTETAKLAREHNNANVLCLGGRVIEPAEAGKIVDVFLTAEFGKGERHARRVEKMDALP